MNCYLCEHCKMDVSGYEWKVIGCDLNKESCTRWNSPKCSNYSCKKFTEQEEIKMCLNCPKESCNNCMPSTGYSSSGGQYKEWQIEYIKEHYYQSDETLAQAIGKSKRSVNYMRRKLGYLRKRHDLWTDEEIAVIQTHPANEAALILGRSIQSVTNKLWQMNKWYSKSRKKYG